MTAAQAIERCDELKPNSYDTAQKLRWLAELDGMIFDEVFLTHECARPVLCGAEDGTGEWELLVKAPYDALYPAYLHMQIDRANNDVSHYNNSASAFSAAYANYTSWFNRTFLPLKKHQNMKFLRRG